MTNLSQVTEAKVLDNGRIWKAGLLAIGASVVANLATFFVLSALLDLPTDFPPLSAGAIAFMTVLFTFIAVVVFAIVARVSKRPIRTYWIIATVAFVISIIPNLLAAMNPAIFPFPGGTTQAFLALIVFHVVAFLVTVGILTTRTIKK